MIQRFLKKPFFYLAHPVIVLVLLPMIMILVVAGTISQKYIGLYASHQMFFGSFVIWWGWVPFPGGYTLLGAFSVSLLAKFLMRSNWQVHKTGIIITHLGALILLVGGAISMIDAHEYYMVLGEGQSSSYIYDYNDRELVIVPDERAHYRLPFEEMVEGDVFDLGFEIKVIKLCHNCEILKRADVQEYAPEAYKFLNLEDNQDIPLKSFASFMALKPKAIELEPEANLSGLTLAVIGSDDQVYDGLYIVFEGMPKPLEIMYQGKVHKIIFGKKQKPLPFEITLDQFIKEDYPGSNKAKAYTSNVRVVDGNVYWPAEITMNQPLRYKGYTFYQSSFDQSSGKNMSVLSVVENRSRLFPYIGTFVLTLGLLVHTFAMYRGRR